MKHLYTAAVSRFLAHCRAMSYSKNTLHGYRNDLGTFEMYMAQKRPLFYIEDISRQLIAEYIEALQEAYHPRTVKRNVSSLRALMKYAAGAGIIRENPFDGMRLNLRAPVTLPEHLSAGEMFAMLRAAYDAGKAHAGETSYRYKALVRDCAVLELLFATGVRVDELCSLHKSHVDLEHGVIQVRGKGNRERAIPVCSAEVLGVLKECDTVFRDLRGDLPYFFVSRKRNGLGQDTVRRTVRRYARLAGIEKRVTPHTLRHTFATLLLENGADIHNIQILMGHSNIMTTALYAHVTMEGRQKTLAQHHPRSDKALTTKKKIKGDGVYRCECAERIAAGLLSRDKNAETVKIEFPERFAVKMLRRTTGQAYEEILGVDLDVGFCPICAEALETKNDDN